MRRRYLINKISEYWLSCFTWWNITNCFYSVLFLFRKKRAIERTILIDLNSWIDKSSSIVYFNSDVFLDERLVSLAVWVEILKLACQSWYNLSLHNSNKRPHLLIDYIRSFFLVDYPQLKLLNWALLNTVSCINLNN